jgi:BMFP domain-containing protein YqiC
VPDRSSLLDYPQLRHQCASGKTMDNRVLNEINKKINDLLTNTPAADVQKNLRALLQSTFAKLDLVTREEFDVQRAVLLRAREKITQLEERLAELEGKNRSAPAG